MSTNVKYDRLISKLEKQHHGFRKELIELRETTIKLTNFIQQLVDEKQGLEATFKKKIERMVDENLEIKIEYEKQTLRGLEAMYNEGVEDEEAG